MMTSAEEIAGWFDGDDDPGSCAEAAARHAEVLRDLHRARILFAEYDRGGYEGDAVIIFERRGRLYEVHGTHCSCNGLEGQWSPEATTVEAILVREHSWGSEANANAAIRALRDAGMV